MKVLIIQQKMIGDVLTTSILFEALKHKYPESNLHYVINSQTYPVIKNNPFIDKFIFVSPEVQKSTIKFVKFLIEIRKERYDAVIDVYGKLSSAFISLFVKAKIKSAYYKNYTSFVYSNTFRRLKKPKNQASLAIENRMKLIEPIGVEFLNLSPKIYLNSEEIESAKWFLETSNINLSNTLIMISVLGSSEQKSYPLHYMAKLIDIIAEDNESQILFNYMPNQKVIAKKVLDLCKPGTKKQIFFNLYGKSLREFLAITKHCDALIGNEGGANNMAKALDVPTFTIFSPYLNKQNWFGNLETKKHVAVHLNDFINMDEGDRKNAKKNPEKYYLKLKPDFFISELQSFLTKIKS